MRPPALSLLAVACAVWLSRCSSPCRCAREAAQPDGATPHRTARSTLAVHPLRRLRRLPQQPDDAVGEDVSIGPMWRAHDDGQLGPRSRTGRPRAPRDDRSPDARAPTIQDECAACHMPMPQRIARAAGGKGAGVRPPADRPADASTRGGWPRDGISCTVCHQIAPDGLGTPRELQRELRHAADAAGRRPARSSGRTTIDAGRRTIMRSVSGFVQEEAPHIKQSELCASCHTLITEAFGAGRRGRRRAARADELPGVAAQRLPARSSAAASRATCPRRAGPVRIVVGARRRARQRSRATCSSAATRSCCGC